MKKVILIILAVCFSLIALPPVYADSVSVNFENPPYVVGSISGQDGWGSGVNPAYDQAVVANSYGFAQFGNQSFRLSDAVTSGSFGDWVFVKPLTDAVGEADATAGTFTTGTLQGHFGLQFDIASTQPGEQPGLHVSVSPDRGDGSRMSYLRFDDMSDGIHVFFDDVVNPSHIMGTDIYRESDIATLTRTAPHTVKLTLDTFNGPGNDVVNVWIDGTYVKSGTSWEDYYRYDAEASAEQSPRIVKTVIFQSRTGSGPLTSPADAGHGFLFDNLTMVSGPVPLTTPGDKNECRGLGWKLFTGPVFKNQGECVSFVAKNIPSGKAAGNIIMADSGQRMNFSVFDFGVNSQDDKGTAEYWNDDYPNLHYTAPVLCATVKAATQEGWFMFQVPDGWTGVSGLYVVSYVKEGGSPRSAGIVYGHAMTTELATAVDWCENGSAPVQTYAISGGSVVISD